MAFTLSVAEVIAADTSGLLSKHESWERVPLAEIASILNGAPFDSALFNSNEGMPLVRIRDVLSGQTSTYYTGSYEDTYVVEPSDLLIGMDGDFNCGYWKAQRSVLNQRVCKITPNEFFYDKRLLAYALPGYLAAINANTPSVTVKHLSSKTIGEINLPLPPRSEQTRIVEKLEELLSDLDAGVSELKAAQKKLVQYRQSLLKAAVEGALTAEWRKTHQPEETGAQLLARILKQRRANWEAKQLAKFQQQGKTSPKGWQDKYPEPVKPDTTDLPELPEGWVYSHLEAFIPSDKTGTKTGPFGSLLKKHEHKKTGVPVIGIENIDRMEFISGSKIHVSPEKALELRDYDLLPGDVVISRSGTVGEVCVIPDDLGDARFSTNIMRVRLESRVIDPKFFCLLLNGSPSVLSQIRELCSGSTRDFLNTEILKTLIFPFPPILEQTAILDLLKLNLDGVRAQNYALHTSLKQSAAQRKNILRAAFSGQLVPQDPNDEPASVLLERIRNERQTAKIPAKRSRRRAGKELSR
ncbi:MULTISPECIES: restriction endonuclease subunit S [Methylomonas]|uniref:Type I restriction modification DNA specificity domain-containing protein n=2 Tax=Methylomonas TaxID=416 RepID=A0A140E5C8_9GAMM|nr:MULTISPECIES: restriction endonuclease subunit S [Methylomonas]AMK75602.1 hypothetical protein JT25_003720 [Methylomonas denitrificans]OAI08866.1 hypothetical protein A1342_08455 [Methylomonas methanica]TCV73853.1 type I restriction enzyme S subunit [Methylomonas methanica]